MKKVLFALFIFFVSVGISAYIDTQNVDFLKRTISYVAPLPSSLITSFYHQSQSAHVWLPKVDTVFASSVQKPQLTSESVLSYDLTTGQLLYSKNIHERLPIASLTKIMTAIVALENESPTQIIRIGSQAANIGEDSMGLTQGEKLSLHELLYGIFLHSGNDAAEAIAIGSKFGRDNFIYQMNKKAEDLGLTDTHFTNPTGLQGDGKQYSSAYDLLVLTEYGLRILEFANTSSTVSIDLPYSNLHKEYSLFNETNLLTSYPGVKGIKTGLTDEAGYCLVTYLDYGGHKIIAVLLNSDDRRGEMKDLLDYSLRAEGVTPPRHE